MSRLTQKPGDNHEHVVEAMRKAMDLLNQMRLVLHEEHNEPLAPRKPQAAYEFS